jgi:UDPglucose 6-dehydrogenase|tara:strand:- start:1196 stop:2395 length:1200 start_codon:yes stop_codon:yes gene_type:complete
MNIVIVGTGYVGLVTGVGFAEQGHDISFIDLDSNKINMLANKELPFFEPGLDEYFSNEENFNRMSFHENYIGLNWDETDIVFICVQTPNNLETNSVDTKFLESAITEISKLENQDITITVKSTIPPYEIENVCNNVGYDRNLLTFNPEFLREGNAVYDFFNPDRVVIGGLNQEKIKKLEQLYSSYNAEIIITDPISSQLIKYLANTYLPMRLSFANEATRLAEYSNANLQDVLKGVGLDSRIGSHYFRPSPSWGGSCFPKDLIEVNNFYNKNELNLPLISNIIDSNNEHLKWTLNQLRSLKQSNNLDKIYLVGAAFKEDTDDLRNSPTLDIYKILLKMEIEVIILDQQIQVPDHSHVSSINDIAPNSLVSIMYPQKDDFNSELNAFCSKNNCVIYYPWR